MAGDRAVDCVDFSADDPYSRGECGAGGFIVLLGASVDGDYCVLFVWGNAELGAIAGHGALCFRGADGDGANQNLALLRSMLHWLK